MSSSASARNSAALLRAYRRTEYGAGPGAVVRPGCRSSGIDRVLLGWGVRHAAFIGAWNPGSRRMPSGWNQRMERALLARVCALPHRPGRGVGQGWSESHVLVALPPCAAAVLAQRFRQAAIVTVARGRAARLVLLG